MRDTTVLSHRARDTLRGRSVFLSTGENMRAGPSAIVLVPAGFFLSVIGRDPQKPGRAMALLWTGVVVLAFSLAVVGASVIAAGVAALG